MRKQPRIWETQMVKIRRNLWWRRRRLAQFYLTKGDRILDLGCGDGLDIQILHAGGLTKITGVDISARLLKEARRRNPGVDFRLASADQLPFPSGIFDVVLADSMLYHLVSDRQAISEISRVLKKGGRLCFIEAWASRIRQLFDWLTFSPLATFVPYLKRRRQAFTAEKEAILRWSRQGKSFIEGLEKQGFKKDFCRPDFLSVVGQYRKT